MATPDFQIQSIEVDWKAVPSNLMYAILSFPNLIDAANHRIDAEFEYTSFPPDFEEGFEERQFQYANLGLKASGIADEIRKTYGIPAREYDDWDPIKFLTESKQKLVKVRARRAEQNATAIREL